MFLNLCKSSTSFLLLKKVKHTQLTTVLARPIGGSQFEIKLTPTAINIKMLFSSHMKLVLTKMENYTSKKIMVTNTML